MNMPEPFERALLLAFRSSICCVVYPRVLGPSASWSSRSRPTAACLKGPDGKVVGSGLIAQPFTKDEYF